MPREVNSVAKVLVTVFGSTMTGVASDADDAEEPNAAQLAAYQIKLAGLLHLRAATEGPCFTTLLAYAHDVEAGDSGAQLAGVATLTLGLRAADAEGHEVVPEGDVVAAISNMAVMPEFRRQGLGWELLRAAEAAALQWDSPPVAVALSVYKHNVAAVRLYERAGYEVDSTWTDERWLKSAERGQVGFQQRQLMVKRMTEGAQPVQEGRGAQLSEPDIQPFMDY